MALAVVAPRVLSALRAYDRGHFFAAAAAGEGLLSPVGLADRANLLLFLAPLTPLFTVLASSRAARAALRPREWAFVLTLAAPFAAVIFVLRPVQGMVRDFDDFAASGVALALVLAALVGSALRSAPRAAWLAPAIVTGALAPILHYLVLQTDLHRGLARVEALAAGPPVRSDSERARTHAFLGARYSRAGDHRTATRHFGRAVELGPSPNTIASWAIEAARAGETATEERACGLLIERAPADRVDMRVLGFNGLAAIALRRGDLEASRAWVDQALALSPADPMSRRIASELAAVVARRARAPRGAGAR